MTAYAHELYHECSIPSPPHPSYAPASMPLGLPDASPLYLPLCPPTWLREAAEAAAEADRPASPRPSHPLCPSHKVIKPNPSLPPG